MIAERCYCLKIIKIEASGANFFYPKPISFDTLVDLLNRPPEGLPDKCQLIDGKVSHPKGDLASIK